ncbi:competence/damage-inducible protein A [bacterium]|nr:competence/damage-inducible protein A [bacterium]
MKAEILSIGSEILSGRTIDTNSAYLGRVLQECGIILLRKSAVVDSLEEIAQALKESLSRADIVITVGGLGPTSDDLTREAISEVMQAPLVLKEELAERIRELFKRRGVRMPEINLKQAYLPEGALPLENNVGTAPGFVLEKNGKIIVALPGPPSELISMVDNFLKPFLKKKNPKEVILYRTLKVVGRPESYVEEALQDLMAPQGNPSLAPFAKTAEIHLVITARGDEETARKLVEDMERKVRERLGEDIFGVDDEELEEVVGRMLRERGLTLAVAESCTGGLLGYRITKISGSSDYFLGGVISYANEVKRDVLGVNEEDLKEYGAVSEQVARQMAEGARRVIKADLGVGITGIAGPTGGTPEKPVGLVYIALATPNETICQRNVFPGDREMVRWRSSQTALDMVRRWLLKNPRS